MVTSQQILRRQTQTSQLQAEKNRRFQSEREEAQRLAQQTKVQQQVAVQDNRYADLEKAARMALSGKGESGAMTAQQEKYYQAILWGDTSKFSGEEKKILDDLYRNKPKDKATALASIGIPTASEKLKYEYDALRGNLGTQAQKEFLESLAPVSTQQIYSGDTGRGVVQYSSPIGASKPIGKTTQGQYVFPEKLTTSSDVGYKSPVWFRNDNAVSITPKKNIYESLEEQYKKNLVLNKIPDVTNNRAEGTIYQRQTDVYKAEDGRSVPIRTTFIIKNGREVKATSEEQKYFREQTNVLTIPEKRKGLEGLQDTLQQKRDVAYIKSVREGGATQVLPQIFIGAGTSLVGTGLFFKDLVTRPVETIKNIPAGIKQTFNVFSSGEISKIIRQEPAFAGGYVAGEVGQFLLIKKVGEGNVLFGRKPKQVVATKEFEKAVQPYTRQRATLILKTEDGKYVLGRTNNNNIISIGGAIEAGQTTKQAILSELYQETGLRLNDIKNLKSKGSVVTAEETFKVYTATISKENLKKIVPSSDVKEIKIMSLNEIGKETGQTAKYPVTLPSGVRSYEAGIINWIETGKKPTLLKVDTQAGEFYLGTQSRYNVPYSSQKKYLQSQEELLFASGTTQPAVLNRFFNPIKQKFEVIGSKTKRGQAEGLYLQPPVSAKKLPPIDFEETFLRKGEKVYLKERQPKGVGLIENRAGTFKKFAKPKEAGYVGLSYAGFGSDVVESLGITFKKPKPTIYTLKEKAKSPIVPTPKTFSGAESELIISPETILRTTGKSERFKIGGKKVFFQPLEIVKNEKTALEIARLQNVVNTGTTSEKLKAYKELNKLTGINYLQGQLTYVNLPSITARATLPLIKYEKTEEQKATREVIEFVAEPSEKAKEKLNNLYREKVAPKYNFFEPTKAEQQTEPLPKEPSNFISKYLKPKPYTPKKEVRKIPPYIVKPTQEPLPTKYSNKKRLQEMIDIFTKQKGIFTKVGEAETPYLAGKKLKEKLLENLSASGYAEKKGKKIPFSELEIGSFATPSKKKGFEFVAVQRKKAPLFSGRLSSFGERRAIRESRRNKSKKFKFL